MSKMLLIRISGDKTGYNSRDKRGRCFRMRWSLPLLYSKLAKLVS